MAEKTINRVYASAVAIYSLTLLVFFAASFYPEYRLWGINWWAYFPSYIPFALLLAGVVLPLLLNRIREPQRAVSNSNDRTYFIAALAITIVFAALFLLLRTRTHFLGDGYTLLSLISSKSALIKPRNFGGSILQLFLIDLLGERSERTALAAYRMVSISAGIVYLAAIALTVRSLLSRNSDRFLFLLGMSSTGYMLLFFGYVENYALFVVSVTLFALIGLLIGQGKVNRWWILPLLVASIFFHVFGIVLAPAAVYLLLIETSFSRRLSALRAGTKAILIALLIIMAGTTFAAVYAKDIFFRYALVPLVSGRFTLEGYTLLSGDHLADYFNLLLLLVPGLPVAGAVLMSRPLQSWINQTETRFLLLLSICCAAAVFVFDPKLGMPRDWDLFAFAGAPLLVLSLTVLISDQRTPGANARITLLFVTLGFLNLFPRIATLALADLTEKHIKTYYHLDKIKSKPSRYVYISRLFEKGDSTVAVAEQDQWLIDYPEEGLLNRALSEHNSGNTQTALTTIEECLALRPTLHTAWRKMGGILNGLGLPDSALKVLRFADGLNPYNAETHSYMANSYYQKEEYEKAERLWLKAHEYDRESLIPLVGLVRIYSKTGNSEQFVKYLGLVARHEALPADVALKLQEYQGAEQTDTIIPIQADIADGLDLDSAQVWYSLAVAFFRADDLESAERYWLRAASIDTNILESFLGLSEVYKRQNRQGDYVSNFVRIARREDAPLNFVKGLIDYHLQQGEFDAAASVISTDRKSELDTVYVKELIAQFPELKKYL